MKTTFICKQICKNGKICKRSKLKNQMTCHSHKEKESCVICFEKIKNEKSLESLNCKHTFCKPCISKWLYLEEKNSCPLCRDLVTNIELYNAFNFCLKENYIATVVYNEYYIENQDLINYILLKNSGSFYYYIDDSEWKELVDYIKLNVDMFELFINSEYITTSNYIKAESDVEYKIINERKYIYKFKINLI